MPMCCLCIPVLMCVYGCDYCCVPSNNSHELHMEESEFTETLFKRGVILLGDEVNEIPSAVVTRVTVPNHNRH